VEWVEEPNDIKVDQVLKIAPPETVASLNAAQTAPVVSPVVSEVRPLQVNSSVTGVGGGCK
jgi:uncharacterized lipoprotein YajG